MYGYIYMTTNLINGKIYIGKRVKPKFDYRYKDSGDILRKAFNKHGKENFSCLMLCPCFSEEELETEERFLIDYFDSYVENGRGYNVAEGGSGGNTRKGMTDEQLDLWRQHLSEANKDKVSHYQSPESRAKISEALKGNQHRLGKRHSSETKKKISEAGKGREFSTDTRERLSESKKGSNNPNYGKDFSGEKGPNYGKSMKGKLDRRVYHRVCQKCGVSFEARGKAKYCPDCR